MITLKILIPVILFQAAFTHSPRPSRPPPTDDALCPDNENNCANNSYCYIYSVTGQPYCVPSCELNNGGCDKDRRCKIVKSHCYHHAPCPPKVKCHRIKSPSPSHSTTGHGSGSPTWESRSHSHSHSYSNTLPSKGGSTSAYPSRSQSRSHSSTRSRSVAPTHTSRSHSITGTTSTFSILPSPSTTPAGPYACSFQPNSGLCKAYFQDYFYNTTTQRCEIFTYGGCGGNDNRFRTTEDCYRTCNKFVNICELDPEVGQCEAEIPRYFYNVTTKRCEKFIYGGCGGNLNRFSTLDQCQRACEIDVCILQPKAGNCRGSFARYFYNQTTKRCEWFTYGGCGGNGNRFKNLKKCEKTCLSSVATVSPTPVVPKNDIVSIIIATYDGDVDDFVAEFTDELTMVLLDHEFYHSSIKVVDISYTPDDDMILSLVVYSDKSVISGDIIAGLINENKETFDMTFSDAVAGESDKTSGNEHSDTSDNFSGGAIAGIVIGIIVGLVFVMLLAVAILYFIKSRQGSTTKLFSSGESDGMDNPIYSDKDNCNQTE